MGKNSAEKRIEESRRKVRQLRFARRSLQYVVRTVLLSVAILAVCVLAFLICSNLSNIYILANEGMSMRAECILTGNDTSELYSCFTSDCIAGDARLSDTTYQSYTVSDYDYKLTVDEMHTLPWNAPVYALVTEQVTGITGTANAEIENVAAEVPAWTSVRYRLEFARMDGRFYITSVTVDEVDPDIEPAHTPDPNATAVPMVTPSPEIETVPVG